MILFNISRKTPNKQKNENKTSMIKDAWENKKLEKESAELVELEKELLRPENRHIYFSIPYIL